MNTNKRVVNDIKDFFFQLENILVNYYDKTYDNVETLKHIEELKEAAEYAGIEINITNTILNNITPSSSYDSSYGTC